MNDLEADKWIVIKQFKDKSLKTRPIKYLN